MSTFVKHSQKSRAGQTGRVSRSVDNLFLIVVILLITGCVPKVGEANPVQVASTPSPGSPQGSVPAASLTPLAENNTIGLSTPIPSFAPSEMPASTQAASLSITVISDADAYVEQSEPDANFGDEPTLKVDGGSSSNESFLRFTVTTLSGTVQNATLRLYSGTNASKNGPAIHAIEDGSWSEEEITWNNRPVYDRQELDNREQINAGTWVEYDVTRAVQGQGTYTFVIAADSGDAVSFLSRESDQAPELVVTYLPGVQPEPTAASSVGEVILVGAGDISMCSNDYDELTARLLDNIPGTVFTTGDNAYPSGRVEDFTDCYDPTWGRHKDRTHPIPGNHDYRTNEGSPYYQYFGNIPPYYAYDLGSWRIYALNSEISVEENSLQVQWLKVDLATHPKQCVLAYWHRPRWSSGSSHGNDSDMQVLWETLYEAGAELVLHGHEHNYERFMPMDAKGLPSPLGMRAFVVGTGGSGPYPFGPPLRTSEVRATDTFGVIKLTLHANSYDWEFIPAEGFTFTDSGSTECH